MRQTLCTALTAVALAVVTPAACAAPPDFSWAGPYVGGDAGGARTSNTVTWTPLPDPVSFFANGTSGTARGGSFLGGLHAGYNWNLATPWVAGVEADFSLTHATGSVTSAPWTAPGGGVSAPTSQTKMSSTLDGTSSLRARLGYLVNPGLLAYATGGVALARIDYAANDGNGVSGPNTYATSAAITETRAGYAAGGGLEWAINGKWLLRGEYRYYHFNSARSAVAQDTTGHFPGNPSGYSWGDMNVNVVQVGLSYKF